MLADPQDSKPSERGSIPCTWASIKECGMTMPGPVNVVKEEAPSVERRRIYEYSVVSATSKETFEQTCGSKLYEKWEPVGGVYVLNPLFIRPTYYQSFRRSFKVS